MKKSILTLIFAWVCLIGYTQTMPAYWVPTTGTNTYLTNITGFTAGYQFKTAWVSFSTGNTGASTITIGPNNVSAAPIRKWDGNSWEVLVAGDIPTITGGARAILTYNNAGSFFELNLLGTTNGVIESVTGNVIDNTDPVNPVVNAWPSEGAYNLTNDISIDGGAFVYNLTASGINHQSLSGGTSTSFSMEPTAIIVNGTTGFAGIQYDDDFSANFTATSLINRGFLDGRYLAGSALTKTGTTFSLGGTMSGSIAINSNTANTNTFSIGATTRPQVIQFNAGSVAGNNYGNLTINDTQTTLTRQVGNPMSINMSSAGMIIQDLAYTKGMAYAADYSTNFSANPRGIPDVGWVNTQTANAWPLTGTRSFTGNATIAGSGFNASIGQSGDRMGNFRVWSNGTVGLDGSTNAFIQTGASTVTTSATAVNIATGVSGFEVNAPTVEMTVDTDYRYYNTANNNYMSWGSAGVSINLDEVEAGGTFAINDSDTPIMVVGALGTTTFYTIPEFSSTPTITNDLQLIPKAYADTKAPLYMAAVTYTANRVGTTADVGKIIYMNVGSANTFTINSGVYEVGTFLNVRVLNAATTAVEGASVTINPQSGSLELNSSGMNVFYQKSADVWELYNGSDFQYTDATTSGDITITTTGHAWTFTGGDFVATDGTRTIGVDAGNGIQLNFGSDATGDMPYRNSSGFLTRLPVGSNGNVLTLAGGLPTWAAPGGVSDGDKGDITVSGSGATYTIDASTITYAKMQNAAGGTRIIGRSAASAGGLNEIVATANGQVFTRNSSGILAFGAVDLADADAVGSSILPVANGGTGLSSDIRAANNTWTGTNTFSNTITFGDVTTPTKQMHFDVSGVTAATNRTVTIPDVSGRMVVELFNQATLNFDLTAVDEQTLTITVTGAADGDKVIVGAPNAAMVTGVGYNAWVSATDTVSIRFFCHGVACASNPGSGTFKVSVIK